MPVLPTWITLPISPEGTLIGYEPLNSYIPDEPWIIGVRIFPYDELILKKHNGTAHNPSHKEICQSPLTAIFDKTGTIWHAT